MKGWPDYTRVTGLVDNYDEYAQNYPVGIGDGAARLGSIKTYDTRGRVWWMDNFEATVLHWPTANTGVGGSQALSTAEARNGNQSVCLTSNTGFGRESDITRFITQPRRENVGAEIHISNAINFGTTEFWFGVSDGTDQCATGMRINEVTGTIEFLDDAMAWQDTGFYYNLSNRPDHFHALKIVMNYKTNDYLRVLWDFEELDLTGIPAWTLPGASTPLLFAEVNNIGDGINNVPVYVDDCIITTMEPT